MPRKAPSVVRLTGPAVFGVRPGSPLRHRLTAWGCDGIRFEADGLPRGIRLDPRTGILDGRLRVPGRHTFRVAAFSDGARAERDFTILCGSRLALTPPMGWSSWNCWGESVSSEHISAAAQAMEASGLAAHGWSHVNIDDGWQGARSGHADHALQPNDKFPDMSGLVESIHALGLRAGIYSSPWAVTYAGYRGSSAEDACGRHFDPLPSDWPCRRAALFNGKGAHSFIQADARQFAQWGFDYLKYDWFPVDASATRDCAEALRATGRDIVLSLSNTVAVSTVPEVLGHAQVWRTTNDLIDAWTLGTSTPYPFQGVRDVARWHEAFQTFQSPGAWNDPDMLVLGRVGWGKNMHESPLTRDEQTSHFALWCLWSAPLLLGCSLTELDSETLSLLTNDDLLDINQDPAGVQASAHQVGRNPHHIAYVKPLACGDTAVGLFNFGEKDAELVLDFKGIAGCTEPVQLVLDCLGTREFDEIRNRFVVPLRPHACAVYRLTHPSRLPS